MFKKIKLKDMLSKIEYGIGIRIYESYTCLFTADRKMLKQGTLDSKFIADIKPYREYRVIGISISEYEIPFLEITIYRDKE